MLAIQLGWASSAGVDLIRFAREWAASEGAAMAVCRSSGVDLQRGRVFRFLSSRADRHVHSISLSRLAAW